MTSPCRGRHQFDRRRPDHRQRPGQCAERLGRPGCAARRRRRRPLHLLRRLPQQRRAADRITDFSHAQGDRVDLSAIDADTGAAGNQSFSFIGTAAFTHHAGELRYVSDGGVTTIAGDVNSDGVSDFQIQLTGAIGLVAADFVL